MTDTILNPPPFDLALEWHVLAHMHAGYLPQDAIDYPDVTKDRAFTLARLRAGTLAEWELDAFALLPALSDRDIAEQVERLRELRRRRELLAAVVRAEAELRIGEVPADDVRTELLEALA